VFLFYTLYFCRGKKGERRRTEERKRKERREEEGL
jgi:hypothetical protein